MHHELKGRNNMSGNNIEFDYDIQSDSLFVYRNIDYEYDVSFELGDDVIMDFDKNNVPVAFEFLNASKLFKMKKIDFNNLLRIRIKADINEDEITLNIHIVAAIHNKNTNFDVNRVASNIQNIPVYASEFDSELVSA